MPRTYGRETWVVRPPSVMEKNPIRAGDVMFAALPTSGLQREPLERPLRWATALVTVSVINYEPEGVDVAVARDLMPTVELALL